MLGCRAVARGEFTVPIDHVSEEERAALAKRYLAERDKRLRAEGRAQFTDTTGTLKFDEFKDPYSEVKPRAPLHDHVPLLIVGAGFAGLGVSVRLKQEGITDFRIIDGAGDFGGVWYFNRFPGAMCDTPSILYLPLLEETGTVPTQKFARGPEILAHAQRIARKFDLYPNAVFHTRLTKLTWDDDKSVWIVETSQGDRFTASYVSLGVGPLSKPQLPHIPGLKSFKGTAMHTARWDFNTTGGGWNGEVMEGLKDKRVGIIGTGATAIQVIPELGRDSGELYVFQRTPSHVAIRNNGPLDKEWFASLKPGWQLERTRNYVQVMGLKMPPLDLSDDSMSKCFVRIGERMLADAAKLGRKPTELGPDDLTRAFLACDDEYTSAVRNRCDEIVSDPKTAEKLKAWYRQLCKRPCFHDEYLPTFNRPTVHLIDTDGKGVERIDETGVWASGTHYPLDVLVYATGFDYGNDFTQRASLDVYGRHGVALSEAWKDGLQTFQGMHVHGFPNLFFIQHNQGSSFISNVSSNYIDTGYTIAGIINKAAELGAKVVETFKDTQDAWVALFLEKKSSRQGIFGGPDCTPGYYNNEGQAEGRREILNRGTHPEGSLAFFDYIAAWRADGKFDGLGFDGEAVTNPTPIAPTGVGSVRLDHEVTQSAK